MYLRDWLRGCCWIFSRNIFYAWYDWTMEFYDDSPATKLFTSDAIVLSGGREQDPVTRQWTFTEKILYIDYNFASKAISISIHDDVTRAYLFGPLNATDYPQAKAILLDIEAEYPDMISSEDFLYDWETFFTAMDKSVWVEGDVTDYAESCEQCGDVNVDTFAFLYVPAVPGSRLNESSLCLHWEFGCFGGTKYAGTYDETVDDVRSLLNQMESKAKGNDKLSIKNALAAVETAALIS